MGVVAITGAAGRIGLCLARGLADAGIDTRLLDLAPRPEGTLDGDWRQCDLAQPEEAAANLAGVDAVIHLAGHPNSRDWTVVERANVAMTRIVLEAAGAAGARRVLLASSIHVWGWHASGVPFSDDLPLRPDGPYGVSKVAAEAVMSFLCDRYGMAGFALRICSFKAEPVQARDLRTWLSPADMVSLALACLASDETGVTAVWGLSANKRAGLVSPTWRRLGYRPVDDAERHVAALRARGVDTNIVSEWPRLGGAFAEWDAPAPTPEEQQRRRDTCTSRSTT